MKLLDVLPEHYKTLEDLMAYAGAIHPAGKIAYPMCVYMNPKTFKEMEELLFKAFKKKYPYLYEKKIRSSMGMYMLNLSPSENEDVPEDSILVDDEQIADNIIRDNQSEYYKSSGFLR